MSDFRIRDYVYYAWRVAEAAAVMLGISSLIQAGQAYGNDGLLYFLHAMLGVVVLITASAINQEITRRDLIRALAYSTAMRQIENQKKRIAALKPEPKDPP